MKIRADIEEQLPKEKFLTTAEKKFWDSFTTGTITLDQTWVYPQTVRESYNPATTIYVSGTTNTIENNPFAGYSTYTSNRRIVSSEPIRMRYEDYGTVTYNF